jgi:ankyrin repeat protein
MEETKTKTEEILSIYPIHPKLFKYIDIQRIIQDDYLNGNYEILTWIINMANMSGYDINDVELYNNGFKVYKSLLVDNIIKGRDEIVKILINSGANLNLQDNNGYTPLMYACKANNLELVMELIKKGADLNLQNNNGHTALMMVYRHGSTYCKVVSEIAEELIKANKNSEVLSDLSIDYGNTVLHKACQYGHVEGMKLLIEKCPDLIRITNDNLMNPLIYLFAKYNSNYVLEYLIIIDELLERKNKEGLWEIDVNQKDRGDKTALIYACMNADLACVKKLMSYGADIHFESEDGITPLFAAAKKLNFPIIHYLMFEGVDINKKNKNGITAYRYARNENKNLESHKLKELKCLLKPKSFFSCH